MSDFLNPVFPVYRIDVLPNTSVMFSICNVFKSQNISQQGKTDQLAPRQYHMILFQSFFFVWMFLWRTWSFLSLKNVCPLCFCSMPEQGHPEQCDQPAVTWKLHCDRRPSENLTHVQDQTWGFPRPQFSQSDGGHWLPVTVQSVWPGEPQWPLPQPNCDQRQQFVLQLRSGDLWNASAARDRPP